MRFNFKTPKPEKACNLHTFNNVESSFSEMLQSKGDNKETRDLCQPNTKPETRRTPTLKVQECSENYFKSTDISGIWRADDRQAANQHTLIKWKPEMCPQKRNVPDVTPTC